MNVSLSNSEFGSLTENEVKLGQYLDTVSSVHLESSINDVYSFGQVMQIAEINVPSARNSQSPTSLFLSDEVKQSTSA